MTGQVSVSSLLPALIPAEELDPVVARVEVTCRETVVVVVVVVHPICRRQASSIKTLVRFN